MNGLINRIWNIVTRGRVVLRSIRGIGLLGTIQLALVRFEAWRGVGAGKIYKISIAGYKNPVYIRGGESSDAVVLYQIFGVGEYKLATALESVNFILDAGANIGLASLYFLRRYPTAKIMAVEPDSANFELCRKNLAPYRERVILKQGALWSSCCHLVLVPCATEWGLAVRAAWPGEDADIEAFDLPSLMVLAGQPSVDLLKLDIEGSEAEIFNSGAPSWLGAIRNIVIEFHGAECELRFLNAMQGFQYRHIQRPMIELFFNITPPELLRAG